MVASAVVPSQPQSPPSRGVATRTMSSMALSPMATSQRLAAAMDRLLARPQPHLFARSRMGVACRPQLGRCTPRRDARAVSEL